MQLGKKYKYLATLISQKRLPAASIVFKTCKVFEIFSVQGRPGKNIQTADQSPLSKRKEERGGGGGVPANP